jgi:tetratricopeptide (TPR) repeat protein
MARPEARHTALALLAGSNALWIDLDPFGDAIGHYLAARDWLDGSVPTALEARFLLAFQAMARIRLMQPAEWRDAAWRALELYRTLDDRAGLYRALCGLGGAPRDVIDEAQAGELLAEAERIEDPAWSPRQRSRRQLALEWYHDLGGRFEACREAGRRHVALAREAGALGAIPALSNLADTEFVLGQHEVAIALCREAIRTAAAIGRPATAVNAYGNMVPALLERGELDAAEAAIREGRALLMRGLGTAFVLLLSSALLAQRRGQTELAAQLLGCAERAYAEGGHHLHPPEKRIRAALLPALAAQLGAERLQALLQAGARWSELEAFGNAGFV